MLNCTQCAEVLPDMVEGGGDPVLRRLVLEQAGRIERCRRCVDAYDKTARLAHHAYDGAAPPGTCDDLLAFLRDNIHH